MTTFKQYIKESVKEDHVFNFYTLEYIMHAGDKTNFEDWELEELSKEYKETKIKVWKNLCVEGIIAVISEMVNADDFADFPDTSREEWDNFFSWDGFFSSCVRFRNTINEINDPDLNLIISKIKDIFGKSVGVVLRKCEEYFNDLEWHSNYGGKSWARITREIRKFYNQDPLKLKTNEIDHMFDLAHNTGTWLDKFENYESVRRALDIKKSTPTPNLFKDEINNRQIRKWLGKATVTKETPETELPMIQIEVSNQLEFDWKHLLKDTCIIGYIADVDMSVQSSNDEYEKLIQKTNPQLAIELIVNTAETKMNKIDYDLIDVDTMKVRLEDETLETYSFGKIDQTFTEINVDKNADRSNIDEYIRTIIRDSIESNIRKIISPTQTEVESEAADTVFLAGLLSAINRYFEDNMQDPEEVLEKFLNMRIPQNLQIERLPEDAITEIKTGKQA